MEMSQAGIGPPGQAIKDGRARRGNARLEVFVMVHYISAIVPVLSPNLSRSTPIF